MAKLIDEIRAKAMKQWSPPDPKSVPERIATRLVGRLLCHKTIARIVREEMER